ncbi:NUDIX domain-containing protein [Aquibacillus kalidii]|uniref:NUDIX domain-containing protein n=1 Tax=Aquibacillus kalidii TaxID=2762597 RepID=UPI001C99F439|nr:NUDIX domain-containing protein [Aquibacillus kalidii]
MPGGQLELGETPIDCAKRELYEETGLNAHTLELVEIFAGEELHFSYPNGDETYGLCIVYKTYSFDGQIKIDEESYEMEFFNINSLPSHIFKPHQFILNSLFN